MKGNRKRKCKVIIDTGTFYTTCTLNCYYMTLPYDYQSYDIFGKMGDTDIAKDVLKNFTTMTYDVTISHIF